MPPNTSLLQFGIRTGAAADLDNWEMSRHRAHSRWQLERYVGDKESPRRPMSKLEEVVVATALIDDPPLAFLPEARMFAERLQLKDSIDEVLGERVHATLGVLNVVDGRQRCD